MLSRAITRYNLVCGGPLRGQTMMPGIRAGFGDQEGKSNLQNGAFRPTIAFAGSCPPGSISTYGRNSSGGLFCVLSQKSGGIFNVSVILVTHSTNGSSRCLQMKALGNHASRHQLPQHDQQLACHGNDHYLADAALGSAVKNLLWVVLQSYGCDVLRMHNRSPSQATRTRTRLGRIAEVPK